MKKSHDNEDNTRSEDKDNTFSRRNLIKAGTTLAVGAALSPILTSSSSLAQTQNGNAKTLILASHPYPERSVINKALWEMAEKADNSYYRNLETVYGGNMRGFDVAAEHELYHQMERMVLIYPTHWFNLTPMLKAYLNEVWGAGVPSGLRGKELLVVTSTAGGESAYQPNGRLGFSMDQVLTPLAASALRVGMNFSKPLVFYAASGSANSLRQYQQALATRLQQPPHKS